MKILFFILLIFVLTKEYSFAQPSISHVTGDFYNGNSVIIAGSNFGTKSPAAPVLWDDCTDSTKLAIYYSETLPSAANQGSQYNMKYRTSSFLSSRSISMPNDYTTFVLSGAHATSIHGYTTGNNVSLLIDTWDSPRAEPKYYVSYYYRVDPVFDEENSGGLGDNMKELCISGDATQIYGTGTWGYYNWCNNEVPDINYTNDDITIRRWGVDCPSLPYGCSGNNLIDHYNPINSWVRMEWLGDYDLIEDNPIVEIRILKAGSGQNNQSIDHYGNKLTTYETLYGCGYPDNSNYRSLGIGGFARTNRQNNGINSFRYFANVYVDTVHSRVVIGDSITFDACTIIEPQIPISWNNNTINFTINLGRLTAPQMAYVYIFNSNNDHNMFGLPVSLNGGAVLTNPRGLKIVK